MKTLRIALLAIAILHAPALAQSPNKAAIAVSPLSIGETFTIECVAA